MCVLDLVLTDATALCRAHCEQPAAECALGGWCTVLGALPPTLPARIIPAIPNSDPLMVIVTHSQIWQVDGMLSIDYAEDDLVIMDGRKYHGITSLRDRPGEPSKGCQKLRHSLIHFSRAGM